MTAVMPDNEDELTGTERTAIWNFYPKEKNHYWMTCSYSNTSLLARRKLPEGVKSCEITYQWSRLQTNRKVTVKKMLCSI